MHDKMLHWKIDYVRYCDVKKINTNYKGLETVQMKMYGSRTIALDQVMIKMTLVELENIML